MDADFVPGIQKHFRGTTIPRILPMTPDDKDIVRATWQKVVPIAGTAADLFYQRLFEIDPDLRALFDDVDMDAQKAKLLQALATTIAQLDALDTLAPQLAELGQRHAGYGVVDAHYDTVGAALLWTLEQGLGDSWTPEAKKAWTSAYTLVAGTMRAGAQSFRATPSSMQSSAA
jgi:hemoglobin-like flavoprotein